MPLITAEPTGWDLITSAYTFKCQRTPLSHSGKRPAENYFLRKTTERGIQNTISETSREANPISLDSINHSCAEMVETALIIVPSGLITCQQHTMTHSFTPARPKDRRTSHPRDTGTIPPTPQ